MKKSILKQHFDEAGELIIHTSSGDKLEIHQHDTEIRGDYLIVDKEEERHVVFYDSVVGFDVHESGWI